MAMAPRKSGQVYPFVPPPQPGPGGGGGDFLAVTDIVSRVPGFGKSLRRDRQQRPDNPVEAARHEDLRVDIGDVQDAISLVNAAGCPATPSFEITLSQTAGTAITTGIPDRYFQTIRHDLGFVPNRFIEVDRTFPPL